MGVQDQVKTRPGNLLTPRGVNTPSGYTHEKGVFWGGGGGISPPHISDRLFFICLLPQSLLRPNVDLMSIDLGGH